MPPTSTSISSAVPCSWIFVAPLFTASSGDILSLFNLTGIFVPFLVTVTPKFFSNPKPGATIPPPNAPKAACVPLSSITEFLSTYPVAPAIAPDTIPYLPICASDLALPKGINHDAGSSSNPAK